MSEISVIESLHGRYVAASERFKSLWMYQQCLEGMCHVFGEPSVEPSSVEFESVLKPLKKVGSELHRSDSDELLQELDGIDAELAQIHEHLLVQDNKVSPSTLRRFFQRVKKTDQKTYRQMLGFYTGVLEDEIWSTDRVDKVDYLMTRWVTLILGDGFTIDPTRPNEQFTLLGKMAGFDRVEEDEYLPAIETLDALVTELEAVQSFGELTARGLIQRFRGIKHSLGRLILCPPVAARTVALNGKLNRIVDELFAKEGELIAQTYGQSADEALDEGSDRALTRAVASFREEFETFERRLEDRNVRLDELAKLRESADRLEIVTDGPMEYGEVDDDEEDLIGLSETEDGELIHDFHQGAPVAPSEPPVAGYRVPGRELLQEEMRELDELLGEVDPGNSLSHVEMTPGIGIFRMEQNEILTYFDAPGAEDGMRDFVLGAVALRKRLVDQVGDLQKAHADLPEELIEATEVCVALAQQYLQEFDQLIESSILEGDITRARQFQRLRMRMLREYAGAWLQVYPA